MSRTLLWLSWTLALSLAGTAWLSPSVRKADCNILTPDHAPKLTDLPDDQMGDILPMAKKLAKASGAENYNILQVSIPVSIALTLSALRVQLVLTVLADVLNLSGLMNKNDC